MKADDMAITSRKHIFTITAMVCLILLGIFQAIRLDISRDMYVMANSALGITMLLFDFILMLSVVYGSFRDARLTRALERMIITAFLSNFCSLFIYETYGLAERSGLIHVVNSLSFAFGAAYDGCLWLYVRTLEG